MNQKGKLQFQLRRGIIATTKVVVFLFLFSAFAVTPVAAESVNSISGIVFEDLNLNNEFNLYESKLGDWRINLYQKDELVKTELTNAAGEYYFGELKAGNYRVRVEMPNENSWASVNGSSKFITLKSGEITTASFSYYQMERELDGVLAPLMNVSNYSVNHISPTAVEVTWFTNKLATSQVVFDMANSDNFEYSNKSNVDFEGKTYHSITITNLEPETTYYLKAVSLPNPLQWRGAPKIHSSKFSFTTKSLATAIGDLIEINNTQTTQNNPQNIIETSGASGNKAVILGSELSLLDRISKKNVPEVTTTQEVIIEEEPKEDFEKMDTAEILLTDCPVYIWFLLILNLIAIYLIRLKGKRTTNVTVKNFWWLLSILAVTPTIIGYPQCWTALWLLFTLFLAIILIGGFRKKPPTEPLYEIGTGSKKSGDKTSSTKPETKPDEENKEKKVESSPPIQMPARPPASPVAKPLRAGNTSPSNEPPASSPGWSDSSPKESNSKSSNKFPL